MTRTAHDVFDFEQFWKDVNAYRERQGHTLYEMFLLSMLVPQKDLYDKVEEKGSVSLKTLCHLTKYADLDLNKYVR